MSEPNKEELARLLHAMADGEHAEHVAEEAGHHETGWAEHQAASPVPVVRIPPRPNLAQATTQPRPAMLSPTRELPMPPETPISQAVARSSARPRFVQKLGFKRTLIPILLTLGVVCPAVGLTGFLVGPLSPYYQFRETWFCVPLVIVGFVMLVFAVLTMLQVRAYGRRQ